MEKTVNIMPCPYGPHEGTPVPPLEEAGFVPEMVWMLLEMKNLMHLLEFEPHMIHYIV